MLILPMIIILSWYPDNLNTIRFFVQHFKKNQDGHPYQILSFVKAVNIKPNGVDYT